MIWAGSVSLPALAVSGGHDRLAQVLIAICQTVLEVHEDVDQLLDADRVGIGPEAEAPEADDMLDRAQLIAQPREQVRSRQKEVTERIGPALDRQADIGVVVDFQRAAIPPRRSG